MTDKEKLEKIRNYVQDVYPVFRPAIFFPPEEMAFNRGHDAAMYKVQVDLLRILDE